MDMQESVRIKRIEAELYTSIVRLIELRQLMQGSTVQDIGVIHNYNADFTEFLMLIRLAVMIILIVIPF